MRRWLLGVVVVACSTPPSKPHEVYTPPDDEGSAVAYQQAHKPPPPDPHDVRFDWDKLRADNETWLSKPFTGQPCDPRYQGAKPKGVECLPPDPRVDIAALLVSSHGTHDHFVQLSIDRGSSATITADWYAAVLDPVGRPRGPWVHLDSVDGITSKFTIEVPLAGSGDSWKHVVVVKEVPK